MSRNPVCSRRFFDSSAGWGDKLLSLTGFVAAANDDNYDNNDDDFDYDYVDDDGDGDDNTSAEKGNAKTTRGRTKAMMCRQRGKDEK